MRKKELQEKGGKKEISTQMKVLLSYQAGSVSQDP